MQDPTQFTMNLLGNPRFAEADFREAPSNAEACAWLRRTGEWPNRCLALWGEAGRGKTHLLHIWAERTGASMRSGADLTGLLDLPPAGMAIDDADALAEERALLHLLNAAGEAGMPVLLAARLPPARWPVRLADLRSRLRAIHAVEIGPPEDSLLRALLARHFADRQLRPSEAVQSWLVQRLPRSAAALREAVERLDAGALETHQNITPKFAAKVLADMLAADEFLTTQDVPSQNDEASL